MNVYPYSYSLVIADAVADLFAGSVIRLWKAGAVNPAQSTTIAECDAAECNFSGYPAAGIPVPAFTVPVLSPQGGALFNSGFIQFVSASASPFVSNVVGGFYVESATGSLQLVGSFDSTVPISGASQAVSFNIGQVFCRPDPGA